MDHQKSYTDLKLSDVISFAKNHAKFMNNCAEVAEPCSRDRFRGYSDCSSLHTMILDSTLTNKTCWLLHIYTLFFEVPMKRPMVKDRRTKAILATGEKVSHYHHCQVQKFVCNLY